MDKQLLASAGFDLNWLQQMEQKYGATIFAVIGDFMNQGFTATWVIATLEKVHPILIDVLAKVFTVPALAAAQCGSAPETLGGSAIPTASIIMLLQQVLAMLPALGLSGWKLYAVQVGLNTLLAYLQQQPLPTA